MLGGLTFPNSKAEEPLDGYDYNDSDVESWVYVVLRGDDRIKIGMSIDLERRLQTLEREHGPLLLFGYAPGGRTEEWWLHRRWAHRRLTSQGEWFELDQELLDQAAEGRLFDRPGGLCRFKRERAA